VETLREIDLMIIDGAE
jgi:hypothetical protein